MPRTQIDALVTLKSLELIASNDVVVDAVLDDRVGSTDQMPVRNVCAKLSNELADRLDNLCGFLSISKRRFIEAAIIDALEKSTEIIREEGVNEHLAVQESRS